MYLYANASPRTYQAFLSQFSGAQEMDHWAGRCISHPLMLLVELFTLSHQPCSLAEQGGLDGTFRYLGSVVLSREINPYNMIATSISGRFTFCHNSTSTRHTARFHSPKATPHLNLAHLIQIMSSSLHGNSHWAQLDLSSDIFSSTL